MPLFKKNNESLYDFSALAVDFHNHVIPGIDDGSPSLEESLKMLKAWADMGFRKIIASPHVIEALYPNSKDVIMGQMYRLREAIEENNIPLQLEATAEYRLDFEFHQKLESGELLPFGERNYIMIELPFQKPAFNLDQTLFELQSAGYEPILAHPERYFFLYTDFKKYYALKDRGLLFQLNLNSLNGVYNRIVRRTAEKMIKNNMIEFACSDAHHIWHLEEMKKLLNNQHYISLVKSGYLRNNELV